MIAESWLVSLGRHTVTGALTTCGQMFQDWSAAYRLFERERFDADQLFGVVRETVTQSLAEESAPYVVIADDTLVRKTGRKVAHSAWYHDPLGPPFTHQIAWGQKILELCAILPPQKGTEQAARAIPVDLVLRQVPKKPRKPTEQMQQQYSKALKEAALPKICAARFEKLRQALDHDGQQQRLLIGAFDGGYTNKALFTNIPERCVFVGRIRKDAALFAPPEQQPCQRGRRRFYGEALPKPEELLKDEAIPWQQTLLFAAGKWRLFQYKTIERCRWRGAGEHDLRLLVVRPLCPIHQAGRRLFFAHPGYLLASDPSVAIETILQAYLWRWEIEVGFQEQKTQLGLGEAQTRTNPSSTAVLKFQAYIYSLALLAAHRADIQAPPRPKWQPPQTEHQRITFSQIISLMRQDLWGRALGLVNKTDFATTKDSTTKSPKIQDTLSSAVIYATR